jgi:ParB family chromosome partitioning protein
MIALSGITAPLERLRALRQDNIDAIAESMKTVGQLQDILLCERLGHGYWVVAGHHRLEAARKLKWDTVRCTILEDIDADEAELIEIDENLIRAELSPAEQALHITRRKELYEKLHPETKQGAIGRGRGKEFSS